MLIAAPLCMEASETMSDDGIRVSQRLSLSRI